jgi:hypothetical protein
MLALPTWFPKLQLAEFTWEFWVAAAQYVF